MKIKIPAHKQQVLALFLVIIFSFGTRAQSPPDAGQTSRELQKQPELNKPPNATKPTKPLPIESTAPHKQTTQDVRITVKAIHVTGSSVYPANTLEAIVADLVGREVNMAELEAGIERITAFYRANFFVVARAYLPPQQIDGGVIVVKVLEGRLEELRINNQSRVADSLINAYLSRLKNDKALQSKPIDRSLLLLNDMPGVGVARGSLQPGVSVGTSDLIVELTPSAPYSGKVELDNYGNRYTGENRLGAALAINSPYTLGDQISLRALISEQNLTYGRLAYQLPVGSSGLRAGAAYSDTRYKLGKEFAALEARGTANSGSLFATYPIIRSQVGNLTGTLSVENKNLNDRMAAFNTATDKNIALVNLGLAGNIQDTLNAAAVSSFELSLVSGRLSMDATSLDLDNASTKSNGPFTRLAYNISRQQRLTNTYTLALAVSGQLAGKNLNSSEKFSLGGVSGVRAYPQGEGVGDQGLLVNLELLHAFKNNIQGLVFYDYGSVEINRNPFTVSENTRSLSGFGVGMNVSFAGLQLKTHLAWRTAGGAPTSEPVLADRNPRLWVQVGKQF